MAGKGPSEGSSITQRLARIAENATKLLNTPLSELRGTLSEVLADSSPNLGHTPQVQPRPPQKAPLPDNVMAVNLEENRKIEAARSPKNSAHLLTIRGDDGEPRPLSEEDDARVISAVYKEVFTRMADAVFVAHTHPVFSLASEMFQKFRIRPTFIEDGKTFNEVFKQQIAWFFREEVSRNKALFSPGLVYHWRCYYGSEHFGQYEENLRAHKIREVQLYAIVMRSFFRQLDEYFKKYYSSAQQLADPKRMVMSEMQTDRGETEGFRDYAQLRVEEERGELLRPYGLSSFFPESDAEGLGAELDELSPFGFDGAYFYDTNLFVSAQVEKYRHSSKPTTLGAALNGLSMEKTMAERFKMPRFFHFPAETRDISVKNLALWKSLKPAEDDGRAKPWADYESVYFDEDDHSCLTYRLAQAFQGHSSIEGILYSVFPDLDLETLDRPGYRDRFKKVAHMANNELVAGFFGMMGTKSLEDWAVPRKIRGELITPLEHLKRVADEQEIDKEFLDMYDSQWNFLKQPTAKGWDPSYDRFFSRVARLSGWRKKQKQARIKGLSDKFRQMHWDLSQHPIQFHNPEWWNVLESMKIPCDVRRSLTFPFMISDGRVVVCHFRHLKR